jgi:hypothetical protein
MKRFVLVVMSLLTLVLSACGVTEAPDLPLEDDLALENQLEIAIPDIEWTGCSLPVLYLSKDAEPSEVLQDCFSWSWVCKRPEAKPLQP